MNPFVFSDDDDDAIQIVEKNWFFFRSTRMTHQMALETFSFLIYWVKKRNKTFFLFENLFICTTAILRYTDRNWFCWKKPKKKGKSNLIRTRQFIELNKDTRV